MSIADNRMTESDRASYEKIIPVTADESLDWYCVDMDRNNGTVWFESAPLATEERNGVTVNITLCILGDIPTQIFARASTLGGSSRSIFSIDVPQLGTIAGYMGMMKSILNHAFLHQEMADQETAAI